MSVKFEMPYDAVVDIVSVSAIASELGIGTDDFGYLVLPTEGDCVAFLELIVEAGAVDELVELTDDTIAFLGR